VPFSCVIEHSFLYPILPLRKEGVIDAVFVYFMVRDEEVLLFFCPMPLWIAECYHDFIQHLWAFILLEFLFEKLLVRDIVKGWQKFQ
jgi:hypothetical protein